MASQVLLKRVREFLKENQLISLINEYECLENDSFRRNLFLKLISFLKLIRGAPRCMFVYCELKIYDVKKISYNKIVL